MILLFSSELGGTLQKQFKPLQCLKFIHPLWIRFWKIWGKGVPPMPLNVICEILSLVWFCIHMTVYQPELFIISESGSVFNTRDWGELLILRHLEPVETLATSDDSPHQVTQCYNEAVLIISTWTLVEWVCCVHRTAQILRHWPQFSSLSETVLWSRSTSLQHCSHHTAVLLQ